MEETHYGTHEMRLGYSGHVTLPDGRKLQIRDDEERTRCGLWAHSEFIVHDDDPVECRRCPRLPVAPLPAGDEPKTP